MKNSMVMFLKQKKKVKDSIYAKKRKSKILLMYSVIKISCFEGKYVLLKKKLFNILKEKMKLKCYVCMYIYVYMYIYMYM